MMITRGLRLREPQELQQAPPSLPCCGCGRCCCCRRRRRRRLMDGCRRPEALSLHPRTLPRPRNTPSPLLFPSPQFTAACPPPPLPVLAPPSPRPCPCPCVVCPAAAAARCRRHLRPPPDALHGRGGAAGVRHQEAAGEGCVARRGAARWGGGQRCGQRCDRTAQHRRFRP